MTPIWPPLHRDIDIEQYDEDETQPFLLIPPPMPRSRVNPLLVALVCLAVVTIVWVAT